MLNNYDKFIYNKAWFQPRPKCLFRAKARFLTSVYHAFFVDIGYAESMLGRLKKMTYNLKLIKVEIEYIFVLHVNK